MSYALDHSECQNASWAQPDAPDLKSDLDHLKSGGVDESSTVNPLSAMHDGWIDFLKDLDKWIANPSSVDDGESRLPTLSALHCARRMGIYMHKLNRLPPTFVVPTGDGGVVFERQAGNISEKIIFDHDGSAEFIGIRDAVIFLRQPWAPSVHRG